MNEADIQAAVEQAGEVEANTRSEVARVLAGIDGPGEQHELKTEVVKRLFPETNGQGLGIWDALDSFEEF